jgi:hypothetical protein
MSAKCVRWVSMKIDQTTPESTIHRYWKKTKDFVSYFVGSNIPELDGINNSEGLKSIREAVKFPLSQTWQPDEYRPLSSRTYNTAAACNVPPFSGWENENFSTKLLKRRYGDNHYCLRVQGRKITGILSESVEGELKRQWECFENMEPEIPTFDFSKKLKLVKESEWHIELVNQNDLPNIPTVAKHGEDDALMLLLAFSNLCILVAGLETGKEKARRYEQLALSVLLPIVSGSAVFYVSWATRGRSLTTHNVILSSSLT